MKHLLIGLLFLTNISFAQEPILGYWKFGLINKIDAKELVNDANALGGEYTDDDELMIYTAVVIYVMGRCEYSQMFISEFENTVMVETKHFKNPSITLTTWGTWEKIDEKLYRIILESGEDETFVVTEDGTITLADAKYQTKMIAKILANNLKLIKNEH